MSKVYGVFYTNEGNVLFGVGGRASGVERKGAHLPGGSAKGKKPSQNITTEKIRNTLLKELEEEFGAAVKNLLEGEIDRTNAKPFNKEMDGHNVYIVLCEISNEVKSECCGPVKDAKKAISYYDEPFKEIQAINFVEAYNKKIDSSWFKSAMEVLDAYHFNGAGIVLKKYPQLLS